MTARLPAGGRYALAALVVVGAVGLVGVASTGAEFADEHTGTANFTAVDNFPGGGGGGPTADAGGPYAVDEGNSVGLDGTASSTSQGNIRSYSWQITSGNGSLSAASTSTPTYHAPANVAGNYDVTVKLTVTDNQGGTDTDTATVTVRDVGADAPSVDSLSVTANGGRFDVSATVSDPAGTDADDLGSVTVEAVRIKNNGKTQVEYDNTIAVDGDSASISDTTSKLSQNKQYEIRVTVADDSGDTASDSRTRST